MKFLPIGVMAALITLQRLVELRLAARNRAWAIEQGAQEYGASHYPLFFMLHIGWFLGWLVEAWRRGPRLSRGWPLWLALFGLAQGLRYWAIASLGRLWNTRILVVPGTPLIRRGPYRWLPHPNYLAVVLELASVPLLFGAWLTALLAGLLNALLLLGLRIPAEEAALRQNIIEAAEQTGEDDGVVRISYFVGARLVKKLDRLQK